MLDTKLMHILQAAITIINSLQEAYQLILPTGQSIAQCSSNVTH